MESNIIEKNTKNKANVKPETVEKQEMKHYHNLWLKFNALLSADVFEILLNNYHKYITMKNDTVEIIIKSKKLLKSHQIS